MYAMYLFEKVTRQRYKAANSREIVDGSTYDHVLEEKTIKWKKGAPLNKFTGARYNVLHFQGWKKKYLKIYYLFSNRPYIIYCYHFLNKVIEIGREIKYKLGAGLKMRRRSNSN